MTGLRTCLIAVGLGLAAVMAAPVRCQPVRVAYPQLQSDGDKAFYLKVLTLALEKSKMPYALQGWTLHMEKSRALYELEHGDKLDVVWAVTSREREKALQPVRFPLDMGMSGWRVALIRPEDAARFAAVRTLDQLRALAAGQGADWSDTAILKANGLQVVTGTNSQSLLMMLRAGRFDYFLRSVRQVWEEAGMPVGRDLLVEPTLAVHYPSAVYFFVKKDNALLAAALDKGLREARRDGSFERLFRDYVGDSVQRAGLSRRRVFELTNPELPADVRLRPEFWFRPEALELSPNPSPNPAPRSAPNPAARSPANAPAP